MSVEPTASTRATILQAALAEFAEHGPAGARVDRIAAVAGVNKRMLYHYFGDKAGLFQAVLAEAVLEPLAPPGGGAGLPAAVAQIGQQEWQLLAWQRQGLEAALQGLSRALAARQKAGELRQDVSPVLMATCALALHALPGLLPRALDWLDAQQAQVELATLLAPPVGTPAPPRPRVRVRPRVRERAEER